MKNRYSRRNQIPGLLSIVLMRAVVVGGCAPWTRTPADVAQAFFTVIQQDDLKTAATYVQDVKNPEVLNFGVQTREDQEEFKATLERDTLKVLSYTTKGNSASVTVQMTAPDLLGANADFNVAGIMEETGHQSDYQTKREDS